ncbi:MAG: hypothetical protein L0Y50_09870 [Beijerinckiaceae bacterium]|nr:hypothetical protein [Beijerinckiaceae bacterium]
MTSPREAFPSQAFPQPPVFIDPLPGPVPLTFVHNPARLCRGGTLSHFVFAAMPDRLTLDAPLSALTRLSA